MSSANETIRSWLKPQREERKQITISVKVEQLEYLDRLAKTFSSCSGENRTRQELIDTAIESYLKEALSVLQEENISLMELVPSQSPMKQDTVVLAAHPDGFERVFMGEKKWYYAPLRTNRTPDLKYIALYLTKPEKRITHYAEIAENGFEYFEPEGKYIIHLKGNPIPLPHTIPLGSSNAAATRRPKYTTFEKLLSAREYKDL